MAFGGWVMIYAHKGNHKLHTLTLLLHLRFNAVHSPSQTFEDYQSTRPCLFTRTSLWIQACKLSPVQYLISLPRLSLQSPLSTCFEHVRLNGPCTSRHSIPKPSNSREGRAMTATVVFRLLLRYGPRRPCRTRISAAQVQVKDVWRAKVLIA